MTTLSATRSATASTSWTTKARLVMGSEIDVDELRRLAAKDNDEQGQHAPPQRPRPRRDPDGKARRRHVGAASQIVRQVLDALQYVHRLTRKSVDGRRASPSADPS